MKSGLQDVVSFAQERVMAVSQEGMAFGLRMVEEMLLKVDTFLLLKLAMMLERHTHDKETY